PKYVILSHTLGKEEDEVTFQEMLSATEAIQARPGYQKILGCAKQAAKHGWKYIWVDTCCIDKTSSAELSEAINSMFRWYQDAEICYAYLSDINGFQSGDKVVCSRWFTRGWTLQELIAPRNVEFFDCHWIRLDNRTNLPPSISRVTRIPRRVLVGNLSGDYSVAQIMSWAAERTVSREEDMAYCLLGLLGIKMPLIYGERTRAFQRLQQEFMRISTDHSLFS
ncbi:HET-domain-containing protein, partial [Teratosphaeria nubilosa]